MTYRADTGEILGVHIIGLHAADLIHEASNAIATCQTVQVTRASPHLTCVLFCEGRLSPHRTFFTSPLSPLCVGGTMHTLGCNATLHIFDR